MSNLHTHAILKLGRPDTRVLLPDAIDEVTTEAKMNRLIPEDVVELLTNALHHVLAVEAKYHCKAGTKEDSFHNDRETDALLQDLLHPLLGIHAEVGIEKVHRQLHLELILVADGGDFVVHGEDLTLIQPQTFDNIMERLGVDRFFESFAQQIRLSGGSISKLDAYRLSKTQLVVAPVGRQSRMKWPTCSV